MIINKNSLYRLIDNFNFVFQPKRKPQLFFRIIGSTLKSLCNSEIIEKPLRSIDIALDYKCNLSCVHCSCENLKKDADKITEKHYQKIALEALDLGTIYFAFTGGEPLLDKNLEDIIQIFHPDSCLIGLQTNALLLDNGRIASLHKAGVDVLQISLDSGDPEMHDSFRNKKGAFNNTIKNIDNALKNGLRVIISSTITHNNIQSEGLLELLNYSKTKNLSIVISVPCPVGKWTNDFSEQLNENDREHFIKLQQQFPHLRRDFHSNYFRLGCSAAAEKLYITPYGDVIPCPFIHISFGNIINETLSNIRKRMLKVNRFTEYNNVCLAGEDLSFINKYILPTYANRQLPQNWDEHPVLKNICK